MKIGMQTWGSDGDIRPFIGLAGALSSAGHEVTLFALSVDGKEYSALARALGFKMQMIPAEINLLPIAEKMAATDDIMKHLSWVMDGAFFPFEDAMFEAAMQLCNENELIIGHHIASPVKAAADKTGRDYCSVFLSHGMLPSRFYAPDPLPNSGTFINGLYWKLVEFVLNRSLLKKVNGLREKNGIALLTSIARGWQSDQLNLVAVSPSLCQHQPDWGEHIKVCGFLEVPLAAEAWQPSPELDAFLKSGEVPVYFTFGSMGSVVLKEECELMLNAARLSGKRAIVQADWDALSEDELASLAGDDSNILRVSKLPHHHIFPLCAVVIHHGGAGTSHSASRSGAASVVVAHGLDQPFWGSVLKRMGIGGKVLNRRKVTPAQLAAEVRAVYDNKAIREKAAQIGASMAGENGLKRAVELIEDRFKQG